MRSMFLAAALLLGVQAAAQAQPAQPAGPWSLADDRLTFSHAPISLPRRAATADHYESAEFSHAGEGLDSAIKYQTADKEVFATVYVYYPSIAHSGVQAVATDQAIRLNSREPVEARGTGVAAAGGQSGVAVTADYGNYLGRLASKSAFIKAGRWMVKIRVSGPESRAAEVASIMAALLDGIRLEGRAKPHPAAPISAGDCPATERRDARLLRGDADSGLTGSLLATFDAAGLGGENPADAKEKPLLPRIGRSWCRTILDVQGKKVPMLLATDPGGAAGGVGGQSVLLVLYSDAGAMFEVVRVGKEGEYQLLNHRIGEVEVLGSYDAVPSEGQLRRLFLQPGEDGRIRARVRLKANGDSAIEINMPAADGKKKERRGT